MGLAGHRSSLGAQRGDKVFGLYEPAGGTAPDIAGKGVANPIAQILSAAMMLLYSFDSPEASNSIMNAVRKTITAGYRTGDIFHSSDQTARKVGTKEIGDAIAAAV